MSHYSFLSIPTDPWSYTVSNLKAHIEFNINLYYQNPLNSILTGPAVYLTHLPGCLMSITNLTCPRMNSWFISPSLLLLNLIHFSDEQFILLFRSCPKPWCHFCLFSFSHLRSLSGTPVGSLSNHLSLLLAPWSEAMLSCLGDYTHLLAGLTAFALVSL